MENSVSIWTAYGSTIITFSIAVVLIAGGVVGYFFLKKKMQKKLDEQQTIVEQHKVAATILVLEKKKTKIADANIPKSVVDQIPKVYKIKKVPIVKAKIGPQVMDLLCDEAVFDKLPARGSVKVDMAGIFIAGIRKDKR